MKKISSSRRNFWMGALLPLLLLLPGGARAAQGNRRILILRSASLPFYDDAVSGFMETLSAHKISFTVEDKILPREDQALAALAQDLHARPPDLVFTVGTLTARFMREQGGGIPFVYAMIVDPDSIGLTSGGAVMEVSPAAQYDFIHKNFPSIHRIGVIYSAQRNRDMVSLLRQVKPEGFSLNMVQAETPEEVAKALSKLSGQADCLLMISDAVIYSPQTITSIILQTIQNNLPIIAISPSFVKAGALAAVYPDYKDNGVLAADVAVRFFNGESLDSIPPQRASKTREAVNLIVAQRLGIRVSDKTTDLASEVVK